MDSALARIRGRKSANVEIKNSYYDYNCFYDCDITEVIIGEHVERIPQNSEISSFSKLAGFTGLRCSYSIVPKEILGGVLNKIWGRRQATKFNGVAWPVQKAAEAALTEAGLKACHENIDYYLDYKGIDAKYKKKFNGNYILTTIFDEQVIFLKPLGFFIYLLQNLIIHFLYQTF